MCKTFFLNDTATTEIYTLSLHDALPISRITFYSIPPLWKNQFESHPKLFYLPKESSNPIRSEEHTSELQSRQYLVCRLLLEKTTIFRSYAVQTVSHPPSSPVILILLLHS